MSQRETLLAHIRVLKRVSGYVSRDVWGGG